MGDWIYFNDESEGMYRIKTNGTQEEKL